MSGRNARPRARPAGDPGGLTVASADGDVGPSRVAGTRAGENGTVQSAQEPAQMVPSPASPMSPARAASLASAATTGPAGQASRSQPAAPGAAEVGLSLAAAATATPLGPGQPPPRRDI